MSLDRRLCISILASSSSHSRTCSETSDSAPWLLLDTLDELAVVLALLALGAPFILGALPFECTVDQKLLLLALPGPFPLKKPTGPLRFEEE